MRKEFCCLASVLLLVAIGLTPGVWAENNNELKQSQLIAGETSDKSEQTQLTEAAPAKPAAGNAPLIPAPAQNSNKARLTADEVRYVDEIRQIEATGHAMVTYSDTIIEADYILIDQDMNAMFAKGNVKLTKDGSSYTSERLLYYFKTEEGWMAPINSEVSGKDNNDVKEPIKVMALEAFLKGEDLLINKPYVTGCDREAPHYHFTADSVEYQPDERLVLHNVWYWEGKVRLFYLPRVSISLRKGQDGAYSDFEMPEIGYSDDKGWYLAWGYNYYINKKNSARFYLDKLTQWGGNGFGVTHTYTPKTTVTVTQDYFFKENSNMGYPKDDYRVKYGYKNSTNVKLPYETTLTAYQNHDEQGRLERENLYYFYLYGKTPWPYLKFYFHDTDSHSTSNSVTTKDTYREMKFYESWSYDFSKSLSLSTTADLNNTGYLNNDASVKRQFAYSGTLTKNWTDSNLKLYYNNAQVLNGDYSSSNYLPKLTYTFSKLNLPLIREISGVVQYTNLEKIEVDDGEVSSRKTGERWSADLTKVNTLWKNRADKVSFNLTSLYMYRFFNVSDQPDDLTGFRETLSAKYKFTNNLSSSLGVAYTLRDGENNNDFFDESDDFTPGGSLINSWNWSSPKLEASLSGGYSFYTQKPETLSFNTTWKPGKANQVDLSTSYDWDEGIGSTYLKVQLKPKDNWKLNMNLGYNPQTGYWTSKQFQAEITQRLTTNWQTELNVAYDVFNNDFGVANIALVYNWHCRDVRFYYDYLEKEYWALISFKAFPKAKFKLSSDPDDLYSWYTNYDFE